MTYSTIKATEYGGYVYHDGFSIRGISFTPDEQFARYDLIRIPIESAIQFVQCELDHAQWFVWRNATGIALYKYKQTDGDLLLDLMGEQYERLLRSRGDSWLLVKLYQDDHRAVFQINTEIAFKCNFETLPFIFTMQDDSSAILHTVEVPIEPLLADGSFTVSLPFEPQPIDVHTRRVFPSYGIIDYGPDDPLVIALRGHFVDLMRCDDTPSHTGLRAVLDHAEGSLRLSVVGRRIEVYDRPIEQLRLLFSMPGDPSLMLYAVSVATETLRDGVVVDLPKILQQPFDLWLPLLYQHAWIEEVASYDLKRCNTTPLEHGLRAAVSRPDGVLRLSLVGGDMNAYGRISELRLVFSMPGDPSMMLHATTVPTKALQDGIDVDLPKILQQPFDLWLPSFPYQAWIET